MHIHNAGKSIKSFIKCQTNGLPLSTSERESLPIAPGLTHDEGVRPAPECDGEEGGVNERTAISNTPFQNTKPKDVAGYDDFVTASSELSSEFLDQEKLLLTIDWLQFRLSAAVSLSDFNKVNSEVIEIGEYGQYKLHLIGGKTNNYHCKANVYYYDSKVGVLCFDGIQDHNKGTMTYKIENTCLYDRFYREGFFKVLTDEFFKEIETKVLNVSRLDIAIDGLNLNKFFTDFQFGRYEKKKVNNVTSSRWCRDSRLFNGFTIGKRSGNRFIRYYDKTAELDYQQGKKEYIRNYFQNNGFDLSRPVYRFELQCNSPFIKSLDGFNWKELEDPASLLKIFETGLKHFFEFVPSSHTDSNKARRDTITIIDFSKIVAGVYERVKRGISNGIRTAKVAIKRLLSDAFVASYHDASVPALLETVARLSIKNNLSVWLRNKSDHFYKDFTQKLFLKGLAVPHDVFRGKPNLSDLSHEYLYVTY